MTYKSLVSIIRDVRRGVSEQKKYSSVETAIKDLLGVKTKAKIENDRADQVVAGTYPTKHFEMCPEAQKYFVNMGAGVHSKFAEQSAVYHDQLFGLEKGVIASGKADDADVKSAEQTIQKIRTITDFYKEKQPTYLDTHLAKIKSYLGKEGTPHVNPPSEATKGVDTDADIDNTKFPISFASKMQRKLKIIDND